MFLVIVTLSCNYFLAVGWGLSIYGAVLNPGSAVAAYTIDGDGYENFTMPAENATWPVYNWNFIPSGRNVENGIHNLTITSLSQSGFFLDYIIINSSKAYVPPPTLITPESVPTSSSSTTTSSPALKGHSSHTDAIAGGVNGGVLLLVLFISMAQLLRRRIHRCVSSF